MMKTNQLSKLELYEAKIAQQEAYIRLLRWRYAHAQGGTDTLTQLSAAQKKLTKLKAKFDQKQMKHNSVTREK